METTQNDSIETGRTYYDAFHTAPEQVRRRYRVIERGTGNGRNMVKVADCMDREQWVPAGMLGREVA